MNTHYTPCFVVYIIAIILSMDSSAVFAKSSNANITINTLTEGLLFEDAGGSVTMNINGTMFNWKGALIDGNYKALPIDGINVTVPVNERFPIEVSVTNFRNGSAKATIPGCYKLYEMFYNTLEQKWQLPSETDVTTNIFTTGMYYLKSEYKVIFGSAEGCCSKSEGVSNPRLSADGVSQIEVELAPLPALGQNESITWSFEGDSLGCAIQSYDSGRKAYVRAGKKNGTVTVVANYDNCDFYGELELCGGEGSDCTSGSCDNSFGSSSVNNQNGPGISFHLGQNSANEDAGSVLLSLNQNTANMGQPSALSFPFHRSNISATRNANGDLDVECAHAVLFGGNGALRQIRVPQGLVDIQVDNANKYHIDYYINPPNSIGASGLFNLPGSSSLIATYTIEKQTVAGVIKLAFTSTKGFVSTTQYFVWHADVSKWELTDSNNQRSDWSWDVANNGVRTRYKEIKAGNVTVFKSRKSYKTINDHEFPDTEAVGTTDSATGETERVTTYTYYPDTVANTFNRNRLYKTDYPDGRWEINDYDAFGRISKTYTGVGNSAPPGNYDLPSESISRVTEYTYSLTTGTDGEDDDGRYSSLTPRKIIVKMPDAGGASRVVSLTYQTVTAAVKIEKQATSPAALWTDAGNLTTETQYITSGDNEGKISSVTHPDGTKTTYSYTSSSSSRTEIKRQGAVDANGIITDGTQETTVTDNYGNMVSHQSLDILSSSVIAQEIYSDPDELGRPQTITHLGNRVEHISYSCCGVGSTTDFDGRTTIYDYDDLKRLICTTQTGPNGGFIRITNVLDAAGNTLVRQRIGEDSSVITLSQALYDTAGRKTNEINALLGVTTFTDTIINNQRTVTSTSPHKQVTARNAYDGQGGLIITETSDDIIRIEQYNRDGSLQSLSGSAVHPVRYEYGVVGAGETFKKEFKRNRVNGVFTETEWIKTVYDMLGRVKRIEYADGANQSYIYNSKAQLYSMTDPLNVVTTYGYNGRGELTLTTIAPGAADQRVIQTISSYANGIRSAVTSAGYSDNALSIVGVQTASLNGLQQTQTEGPANGGLTSSSTTTYNTDGSRTTTLLQPNQTQTVSTYQNGILRTFAQYSSSGSTLFTTNYYYDGHGRISSATDSASRSTTYTYNNADQVETVTTPAPESGINPLVTQYRYDEYLRRTNMVYPSGLQTSYAYNPRGERTVSYGTYDIQLVGVGYDDQGRLTSMTNYTDGYNLIRNGLCWQPTFSYSSRDTRWAYDPSRGWLTAKYYPSVTGGGSESTFDFYTYDAAGHLKTHKNQRNTTTTYGYNSAGEVTSMTYDDSKTPSITLNRDYLGRVTNALSSLSGTIDQITYAYDSVGQLRSESHTGGLLSEFVIASDYNSSGQRTNLALTGNSATYAVGYGYDNNARLKTVTSGSNAATYDYWPNTLHLWKTTFANADTNKMFTEKIYDNIGRLKSVAHTNSIVTNSAFLSDSYMYSSGSLRTQAIHFDLSMPTPADQTTTWSYKYSDNSGGVNEIKRKWSDGISVANQSFYYHNKGASRDTTGVDNRRNSLDTNPKNQIISNTTYWVNICGTAATDTTVRANNVTLSRHNNYFSGSFVLANKGGAICSNLVVQVVTNGEGSVLYSYTNLVLAPKQRGVAGVDWTYDLDGNPTLDTLWVYEWDAENRLTKMTSQLPNSELPVKKIEFQYDWQGRRIAKKCYASTTGTTPEKTELYLYDGWNLIATATNGTKAIQASYVWGQDLSGTMQGAGGVGGLLMVRDHRSTLASYYVSYDGNGNVIALVKNDGTVDTQYEYAPFGEPLRATGNMAKVNPFRFSTKFHDDETSLVYYGYRYYNPRDGRWLSRDPIGENGGINLYAFCGNDPINRVDRNGLDYYPPGMTLPLPSLPPGRPSRPANEPKKPYDNSCCTDEKIKSGEQQLKNKYDNAKAFLLNAGVKQGQEEPSCRESNDAILMALQPIPVCWTCYLEHRYKPLPWAADWRDHWFVVCFSRPLNGASKEIAFDFWKNRPTGEAPNSFLRIYYQSPAPNSFYAQGPDCSDQLPNPIKFPSYPNWHVPVIHPQKF